MASMWSPSTIIWPTATLNGCCLLYTSLDGELVGVSGSAGITVFPDDGADPEVLLRHADQAMYLAKREGCNRYFLFDPLRAAE